MSEIISLCKSLRKGASLLATHSAEKKNRALRSVMAEIDKRRYQILDANAKDVENAIKADVKESLVDRLRLNSERIDGILSSIQIVIEQTDPVGQVVDGWSTPNGLCIRRQRVPLGVAAIIYESRPNVTADAFGLCFKTGNVVILKGGSDAIYSNIAIVNVIRRVLEEENVPKEAISLIEDTSRETAAAFMKMNDYVDVLIPRGGAGLIKTVVNQATIPVIETGTGNCHIYVDETADIDMAVDIIMNAKTQRIGVCNACESLVIHEKVLDSLIPKLLKSLQTKSVEIRCDEKIKACADTQSDIKAELIKTASEEDWGTEYLDYILSAKTVSSIEEAITHINKYNTGHSEAIITNDYNHAEKFLNEIDAACVYVNASTRFTDGFEFGFGAEIGISTQKLHARGPMGLEALTSTKYIIYGNGQTR